MRRRKVFIMTREGCGFDSGGGGFDGCGGGGGGGFAGCRGDSQVEQSDGTNVCGLGLIYDGSRELFFQQEFGVEKKPIWKKLHKGPFALFRGG